MRAATTVRQFGVIALLVVAATTAAHEQHPADLLPTVGSVERLDPR